MVRIYWELMIQRTFYVVQKQHIHVFTDFQPRFLILFMDNNLNHVGGGPLSININFVVIPVMRLLVSNPIEHNQID